MFDKITPYRHYFRLLKCTLTFVFLLGQPFILNSQSIYKSILYDDKDGFYGSTIRMLMEDQNGGLWLGGEGGLQYFDGERIIQYDTYVETEKTHKIQPTGICECEDGSIWVTKSSGLYKIEKSSNTLIAYNQGAMHYPRQTEYSFMYPICINDKIYIGSYVGLYIYDIHSSNYEFIDITPGEIHRKNHHSPKVIKRIFHDRFNPKKLILTGRGCYYVLDIDTKKVESMTHIEFNGGILPELYDLIQETPTKWVFATYGRGLIRYDLDTERIINHAYMKQAANILGNPFPICVRVQSYDAENYIIPFFLFPPYLIDKKTFKYKPLMLPNIEKDHFAMIKSRNGNIWLGGIEGLMKLEKKPYERLIANNDFKDRIENISVDAQGKYLLIKSDNDKIDLYSVNGHQLNQINWSVSGSSVFFSRSLDKFLISSHDKLIILNPKSLDTSEIILKELIVDYIQIDNHNFLISNNNIYEIDKSGEITCQSDIHWSTPLTLKNKVSSGSLNDTTLYILTSNNLTTLNINSYAQFYYDLQGIRHPKLVLNKGDNYILLDKYGQNFKMVFTTNNSDVSIHLIDEIEEPIYDYSIDPNGNTWITHGTSMSIYNKINFKKTSCADFDAIDGAVENAHSFGGQYGYFTDGLAIFRQPTNNPSDTLSIPEISSFTVQDNPLDFSKDIQLRAKENDISISWSFPYMGNRQYIHYDYRLHDEVEWKAIGNENELLFTNLSPSNYTFQLRANVFEKQSEPVSVAFSIAPNWYQTQWFYVMTISIIGVFIYAYFQYQVYRKAKKSEIEAKKVNLELKALRNQLNPHFIFNSLNSIKSLIERREKETAIRYLNLFSTMIARALKLSEKAKVSLSEEIDFSREYLEMEKLRFGVKFDFIIDIQEDKILKEFFVPPLILQPHLENAIWHGIMHLENKKGIIKLKARRKKNKIVITIDDNGIGRSASKKINALNRTFKRKSRGHALSIDRVRLSADLNKNEVEIKIIDKLENEMPAGTTLILKLTINENNYN